MNSSFRGLRYGLVIAVALVYLLMVVNFQSWLGRLRRRRRQQGKK